jgi:mannose-6-phosphate isomerase-like protein (cupin superfamily)
MKEKVVNKSWGHELWFANVNEGDIQYCGKQIFVRYQEWSSKGNYHYHVKKDETFFVVEGYLQLDWADTFGVFHTTILAPGESFRIKPKIRHRFTGAVQPGCKFIEASTFHEEEDSYRCKWIEKLGAWLEQAPKSQVG